ncbi:MAG: leukotriene-A4 hydrolase [Planctomycetota bacterium]|jgi:leukotriene-A4 hydrolase
MTHLDLDLELDFESEQVRGSVDIHVQRRDREAPLILDTHELSILGVAGLDGSPRVWQLGERVERFGRPLEIMLQPADAAVRVHYMSAPGAEALQWLAPEQTADGEAPFLFTQGQSILTRSWIPLQDSPGPRVSYTAKVRAPEGLTVVMSAESRGRADDGSWLFGLDLPIPAYLIALGAGKLESRDLSERCRVWAEPSLVEAAGNEFADTESMIQAAEELFGEYRWGRYDLLILPPAFPFGGMENPLLTFLTPTVIAGDRSLVSIIAHELAHSWSGNLVTNATWSDFWLNEGTTVYFEQRIMERVYGRERRDMEAAMSRAGLESLIAKQEPWENVLNIDLTGKHPDDGFSGVPYNKGAALMTLLEQLVGREAFDIFLQSWFDEHAFQSVTTHDFEVFLKERLLAQHAAQTADFDLDQWLHAPGLPDDAPAEESDALVRVDQELERLRAGAIPGELETGAWVSQQWEYFVENLPADYSAEDLSRIDAAFEFTQTGNNEVLCAWLVRAIRAAYRPADTRLEAFLMTVGRRKYLQPLYEELLVSERGIDRARSIYASARPRYHAVSTTTLDRLILQQ